VKKLSIIIPVYNGERFIQSCLDSLVSQLCDDVEIIVVNDGSTDGTHQLITTAFEAQIRSGWLRYFNTPNGGVSAARNFGLDNAKGEYIAFVDADDLVSKNYVQAILAATIKLPCIIEFGYRTIDENGALLQPVSYIHRNFGNHHAIDVIEDVFVACVWYPFLRVCKRAMLDGLRFPIGVRFCEDLMLFSEAYKRAVKINSLTDILYDYRINTAGATFNIKLDYATHLISFYRKIAHENTFAMRALKINLAYAIRRCTVATSDPNGRMPQDIERDIRKLLFVPKLFIRVRGRLMIYALLGSIVYRIKYAVSKLKAFGKPQD
jgi:glycosyltransferase involved in cell wall biosynthesis